MAVKIFHLSTPLKIDVMPVVRKAILKLGMSVAVVTTIQHKTTMDNVKQVLEDAGKQVTIYGNILGCMSPKEMPEESVLYIGTGKFHPMGVKLRTGQDVVCADPMTGQVTLLDCKAIERIERRKKGALAKFYASDTVGVIVSVKSGQKTVQTSLSAIYAIKEKYPDKRFYFFGCNTLDFGELENFPFIEVWVNTMCPRVGLDDNEKFKKGVVNIDDIQSKTQPQARCGA